LFDVARLGGIDGGVPDGIGQLLGLGCAVAATTGHPFREMRGRSYPARLAGFDTGRSFQGLGSR